MRFRAPFPALACLRQPILLLAEEMALSLGLVACADSRDAELLSHHVGQANLLRQLVGGECGLRYLGRLSQDILGFRFAHSEAGASRYLCAFLSESMALAKAV